VAIKFVMQEWVDKYYEETGEAGRWDGRLYTSGFLMWCLKHLSEELEKDAPLVECSKCGQTVHKSHKFCCNCGIKF